MLTFEFTGVDGRMTETETLTSGMVGKTAAILFDDSWAELTRTVVFRSGETCVIADGSASPVTIPKEVLARPWRRLYVGVYGTDASGTLVIPTIMAEGPMIQYGADPDESINPEDTPENKGLQEQIGDLADLNTESKDTLVSAVNEIHALLQQSPAENAGLSEAAASLLIEILRHGVYDSNQSAAIDSLEEELGLSGGSGSGESPEDSESPEDPAQVPTGLSVSYSGGDVPAGTDPMELTGVTVVAHYADGTTQAVTDYVLSGTIAEGSNTITVSYMTLFATFTVTGTAAETVTLTGITAVYSGGDVAVGTPVTELSGIIVTAIYSDGSRRPVSGYALSGTIAESHNTITVTFEDKTTGFSVTGVAESGSEQEPSTGQTETLEIVYTTSYPNVTTFAYTERDTAGQYVVAKQGQLKGGLLSVDYDSSVCNQWNLNLYVFDTDGNPYAQTDKLHNSSNTSYNWGQEELAGWEDVGAGSGFGTVYAPFSVQLPEGCTAIACMRYASTATGDGTIDGNALFSQWAKEGGITFTVTVSE